MNFKRYNESDNSWTDSHYIMGTDTDTLTLPAVIYPNDTSVTVGIKGNTVQSGTPTPDNPVIPQGTGEKTGNLWDEDYANISSNATYRPLFVGDGLFTLSTNFKIYNGITDIFLLSGNVSSGISSSTNGAYKGKNITAQSVDGYITIAYRANARPSSDSLPYCKTMLNSGSTALPYEPYGFKIQISSASTATPIYLGEVETTRKIEKKVFTGNELWAKNNNIVYLYNFGVVNLSPLFCTHFTNANNSGMWNGNSWVFQVNITQHGMSTLDEWIAFLQQQYANGTPVTVWYVLAEPETGIVNEPLMKIGTYADSLSTTIPCTAGENTLDVQTTVAPSEVTATFEGWHPVQSVHERENGQWD